MGGISKALVDEFIIKASDHSREDWCDNAVFICRVCFVLLDDLKVDLVKFFSNFLD